MGPETRLSCPRGVHGDEGRVAIRCGRTGDYEGGDWVTADRSHSHETLLDVALGRGLQVEPQTMSEGPIDPRETDDVVTTDSTHWRERTGSGSTNLRDRITGPTSPTDPPLHPTVLSTETGRVGGSTPARGVSRRVDRCLTLLNF